MDLEEIGRRIGALEMEQALTRGSLEKFTAQFAEALADMKANNKRIDDHETRIRLRERAYEERVLPALERLHNLELKVAGSALLGGAVVYVGTELVRRLLG